MTADRIPKFLAGAGRLLVLAFAFPLAAAANTDALSGLLALPGTAGLGVMIRSERSPYLGAGIRRDLVPLYLYDGKRFFIHASRAGLKLSDEGRHRVDLFLDYRFEGFPSDRIPASLAGMQAREPTTDLGVSYAYRAPWGTLKTEFLHDALNITKADEVRLGYSYDWTSGRWRLRPALTLMLRSARLNDYYYGVRADEVTPGRPAYMPGTGIDAWLGLYGSYDISAGWRVLGGVGVNLLDSVVRRSPIVRDGNRPTVFLGAAYDFGSYHRAFESHEPLIVKVLHGKSTDCNLNRTITLRCTSTNTVDNTRIAALELGRPFITRVNGWPLDFVGYVSLLHHDENGLQDNSWQVNAYMKAYYYGFPWSDRIRTRLGFGAGVSFAQRVPYVEGRDLIRRDGNTSRLLNYLDPSIDVSVGDLIGSRALRETYVGFGVSHRSGIFGTSRMLGNVNGGSNYIYSYLEWKMR
ncbi:MAG: structural protein MipA [Betaproteobacteria bacterium RIFCSPLOWO2_12_FULL_65_14]|nr:MAG: structural protein MipA [Betaproteobacteria bacterium RIFCSPLOWO2_12_FULL_65_14]